MYFYSLRLDSLRGKTIRDEIVQATADVCRPRKGRRAKKSVSWALALDDVTDVPPKRMVPPPSVLPRAEPATEPAVMNNARKSKRSEYDDIVLPPPAKMFSKLVHMRNMEPMLIYYYGDSRDDCGTKMNYGATLKIDTMMINGRPSEVAKKEEPEEQIEVDEHVVISVQKPTSAPVPIPLEKDIKKKDEKKEENMDMVEVMDEDREADHDDNEDKYTDTGSDFTHCDYFTEEEFEFLSIEDDMD
ncbi:unnamed protein product [Caenorhabditis auriculariae]|uniref:Uncharacterized protein n=1 Tax=Caenorhabditis auriculariae TaxID=2777116 RepID=A0A8S1GZI3_9PELO|nr:unnamed protein product [Caenorhabditis auriculariae]